MDALWAPIASVKSRSQSALFASVKSACAAAHPTEAWEVDEIHAVMAGKFGTLWRHHVVEAARPWTRTIGGPSPTAS
jgi:hypothetical protein